MNWIGSIVAPILELIAKILPFFFVYKSGKDSVKSDTLERAVKDGKIRNEIEEHSANDMRDDIIKWLRERDGQN